MVEYPLIVMKRVSLATSTSTHHDSSAMQAMINKQILAQLNVIGSPLDRLEGKACKKSSDKTNINSKSPGKS